MFVRISDQWISTKKMNPPSQQVSLGNQQHPPVAPGLFVNSTTPDGKLWVSNVRRSIAKIQSFCGGLACGFCIGAICLPFIFNGLDSVNGGIWTGVIAIVAGNLGINSLTKRGMVIPYRVISICTAVLSGFCLTNAILGVLISSYWTYLPLYIFMGIDFFILMVASIIGAIFTCGTLSSGISQSQRVVHYTPLPLHQQYHPAPPYTVTAAQSGIKF